MNKDMEQGGDGMGGETRNAKNQEQGEGLLKQDTRRKTMEGIKIEE